MREEQVSPSIFETLPIVICHHNQKTGFPTGKNYEVIRKIAEGGFGVVYEGVNISTPDRQRVALKFMHARIAVNPDLVQRFEREARIALRISSPYVIATHAFGRDQAGRLFTVMEYVEAEANLRDLIETRLDKFETWQEGRHAITGKIDTSLVPIQALCTIVMEICEGMQAIHEQHVIHRDLKPENILIVVQPDNTRTIKVSDLGIARYSEKPVDELTIGATLTRTGGIVGTPYFMAPEMIMSMPSPPGASTQKSWGVCVQSDIYALGATIYQMVTGELPYAPQQDERSWSVELSERIWHEQYPVPPLTEFVTPPGHAGAEFQEFATYLIEKMLAKRPWNRPESMRDVQKWFAEFLERYLAKTDLSAPEEPVARTSSYRRRFTAPIVAALLIVLAMFVAATFKFKDAARVDPAIERIASVSASQRSAPSISALPHPPAVHPQALPSLTKRRVGDGPAQGSSDLTAYAQALKSGDCTRAINHGLLMLIKHPAFPDPHRIIAECKRKAGKVTEACEHYVDFLAFENTALSRDATEFVAQKCVRSN
ncbi:MAG: serine/threonine-protein kinase [Patescibacteria group bacterium]